MLFVVYKQNDDKRLVFFPLESTLRTVYIVKFPMPGNFKYLIVDIGFLLFLYKQNMTILANYVLKVIT